MHRILIIDDDPDIGLILTKTVENMAARAQCVHSIAQGLAALDATPFDIVLLDVELPDGNGLDILPQLRQLQDPPEVIIITGQGDPDAAETAIKNGAWDYLLKPAGTSDIKLVVQRALTYRRSNPPSPSTETLRRKNIVGNSAALGNALVRAAEAAATQISVLISGESGVGKELFARVIHDNSSRADGPFIVVDCAALPETLVESILFGHARGAFTGAEKDRQGLVRQAHGGTLFLDEVGEMPLSIQKAFLRVIQERQYRPVGMHHEVNSDFRLIAATNRNLEEMADQGAFREDLLFRLRAMSIHVPPLRRRRNDIKGLARHHIDRLCRSNPEKCIEVSKDFEKELNRYPWPGNIRELFHAIEESLVTAKGEPELLPHHLPMHIRATLTRMTVQAGSRCLQQKAQGQPDPFAAGHFMEMAAYRNLSEYHYLHALMRRTRGNRKAACSLSGLSRTRLFELLKKHHLSQPSTACNPAAVHRLEFASDRLPANQ